MSGEENKTRIDKLLALGKIDAALARILADRKRNQEEISQKRQTFQGAQEKLKLATASYEERKQRVKREDGSIQEENRKIIERRKALGSFNNYKLQQAAEKEIDNVSRQLSAREEALITQMEELEILAKSQEEEVSSFSAVEKEYAALKEEVEKAADELDNREQEYRASRNEVVEQIDSNLLLTYDKVISRFPMDPLAKIENNMCAGCFMTVGPQVINQVGRGESLVRCPGCGRILYLENAEAENKE